MRKLLLLCFSIFLSITSNAEKVKIDGIYYILDNSTGKAETTYSSNKYSGDIVIPESFVYDGTTYTVSSIGKETFSNCKELTSIQLPNSIISIGEYAFYHCESLNDIIVPNGVDSISNHVFYYCKGLTSVTLPNSVKSIGEYAFDTCSSLTSIDLPNSLTTIGKNAFRNCGLVSLTIPESVTSVENSAFNKCNGLKSVHTPNLNAWCNIKFKNSNPLNIAHHLYLNDDEIYELEIPEGVKALNGSFHGAHYISSVSFPESLDSIGDNAFRECRLIESISLPNSVKSIGKNAFYLCERLESIEVPASVTSIGDNAFSYCFSLLSFDFPSGVTTINRNVFKYCENLTTLEIPEGVTSIGESAFWASGLKSITIPSSVTSIDNMAFYACSLSYVNTPDMNSWCNIVFQTGDANPLYYAQNFYLDGKVVHDLEIPNNVDSIGKYAFFGCTSLKSVTVPSSLTSIGESAFNYCTNLMKINIGKNVKTIRSNAFANIGPYAAAQTRSESDFVVNCYAENVPHTESDAFEKSPVETGNLFVNDNSVESYKTSAPWSSFGQIQGFNEASKIESLSVDIPTFDTYDLRGNAIGKSHKGINIIKPKNGKVKKVLVK